MTLVAVSGEVKDGGVKYTITPTIVPDPSSRYRLRYFPTGTADDDINLQVDKNGLLTSAKGNANDHTGDIIVAIAKAASANITKSTAERDASYPFTRIYSLDEFIGPSELILPDKTRVHVRKDLLPASGPAASAACNFSVCFRTVMPVRARIAAPGADANEGTDFAFIAVNPNHTEGIDLLAASLVNRTNTVTFDSGLVKGIAINQPSTALAIASLPLTVLKAILSVPAELLQLKVTNVQDQASLAKAQADLLAQVKALADIRQKTEAAPAKAPAITGTGSSP